jgi:predicted MFS family arabinose efflux permease
LLLGFALTGASTESVFAIVAGVPLGLFISGAFGWRATFYVQLSR